MVVAVFKANPKMKMKMKNENEKSGKWDLLTFQNYKGVFAN